MNSLSQNSQTMLRRRLPDFAQIHIMYMNTACSKRPSKRRRMTKRTTTRPARRPASSRRPRPPSRRWSSRACSPVADGVPFAAPLEETVLREGLYARLRYRGPYAAMKGAYRWLLGVWLPQSGHEPDDDPIFEAYLNNPQHVAPAELITDIHLPLKTS